MDSRASDHFSPCPHHFAALVPSTLEGVEVASQGEVLPVVGMGTVRLSVGDGEFELLDVHFVPGLTCPLLSVARLEDSGFATLLSREMHCIADQHGYVALEVERHHRPGAGGGLYTLPYDTVHYRDCRGCIGAAQASSGVSTEQAHGDWGLWHSRLGHPSSGEMRRLLSAGVVHGARVVGDTDMQCEHCIAGKLAQTPFPGLSRRRDAALDLLHVDLMGPLGPSLWRSEYALVVVDDHSRYTWVRCLRTKDEAEEALMHVLIPEMERQFRRRVAGIRSDNGGEFLSGRFTAWLEGQGIIHELTVPYTPQQNGLAEVTNRTLAQTTRCMLDESGLPDRF